LHIAVSTRKTGREDDPTSDLTRIDILTQKAVRKSVIYIRSNILLIRSKPLQSRSLAGSKRIDDILLKQPPSKEESRIFVLADV